MADKDGREEALVVFRAKGYSDEWIEKRLRGIAVRDEHDRSPCTVHITTYGLKAY